MNLCPMCASRLEYFKYVANCTKCRWIGDADKVLFIDKEKVKFIFLIPNTVPIDLIIDWINDPESHVIFYEELDGIVLKLVCEI